MPKKRKDEAASGQIVRMSGDGALQIDLRSLSAEDLQRHIAEMDAELSTRQLKLADLQIMETQYHLLQSQRAMLVEKYFRQIAHLDSVTPGGLKSVQPEPGDDPDLVAEAWRMWVFQQRGGGSRFG